MQNLMKISVSTIAILLLKTCFPPESTYYVRGEDPVTFTVMSDPILLRPGEVHNRVVEPVPLPREIQDRFRGKNMSVTDYTMDWVFKNGSSVPSTELYNHHFSVVMGNKAGAEYYYRTLKGQDPFVSGNRSANCYERKLKDLSLGKRLMSMKHHGEALEELKAYMRRGISPRGDDGANFTMEQIASPTTVGSAPGNEARHNSNKVPAPFHWSVESPEYLTALFHFINTKDIIPPSPGQGQYSPLLECPCTAQRDINKTAIAIDGECPSIPYACNGQLLAEENIACSIETYTGGYRCCEDGVFLVDIEDAQYQHLKEGPVSEYYAKFTFTAQEEDWTDPLQRATRLVPAENVDVTGGLDRTAASSVEYSILQCNTTDPIDPCVHVLETVVPAPADPAQRPYFELVRVAAHLHTGGKRLTLWVEDAGGRYEKGALICDASVENDKVMYGTKEGEPGNELGYLIGIEPCMFGDGEWIFGVNDTVRIRAEYESSRPHNGAMAMWFVIGAGRHRV